MNPGGGLGGFYSKAGAGRGGIMAVHAQCVIA
jgi:hypothetical protein